MRIKDRDEGGWLLAHLLANYAGRQDVMVLAIPSGGVPVAAAIVKELGCSIDVLVVRTLNLPPHDPWQPEIVIGAMAPGGVRVLDLEALASAKVHPQDLEQMVVFEQRELDRLQRLYRGDRPFPDLRGRAVILATDAIVIRSTMEVAIKAARAKGSVRIVAAAPVGLDSTCEDVQHLADELVCLLQSPEFCSLALWYDDPRDTTDEEVRSLLALADRGTKLHGEDLNVTVKTEAQEAVFDS
jgi:putative phosphoribosyl transferase